MKLSTLQPARMLQENLEMCTTGHNGTPMIKRFLIVFIANMGLLQGVATTTLPGDGTLITNPEGQSEAYC